MANLSLVLDTVENQLARNLGLTSLTPEEQAKLFLFLHRRQQELLSYQTTREKILKKMLKS